MKNPDSKSESKKWDIIISQDQEGIRLDKTLALYPDFASRSRVASLFSSGRVMLEDKCLKPSFIPKAGDCISIFIPQEKPPNMIEAFEFSLEILFEDSHLIVLNKPSGLVVHPSQGHQRDTLVNALVHHTKDLAMGFHEQRPGIVHRLDKDTSGILVVAKNDRAHSFLAKQFKEKTVHRVYQALVYGTPLPTYSTIRSHLHRHPIDRKKFASTQRNPEKDPPQGKLAITHYRTLASSPQKFSLLECRLETGRTHQIRVHLSEKGHPIVGDSLYGGLHRAKSLKSVKLRQLIGRMDRIALHARELGFVHPQTKKLISFKCEWPEEMAQLLTETGFDCV